MSIDIISLLIGILIGCLTGLLIAITKFRKQPANTSDNFLARYEEQSKQIDLLKEQLQAKEQDYKEQENIRKKELEQENKVLETLAPTTETIKKMQLKIEELEKERHNQYGMLNEKLENNQKQQDALMKQTYSLSSALRNNQTRGQWGEVQLKNIVQAAGLLNHVDFETQISASRGDGGRDRPDMIINLPHGLKIIVDAKTPFENYRKACEVADTLQEQLDETGQNHEKQYLLAYVRDVKQQIDLLSKKSYQNNTLLAEWTPDFTIMFLHSEAALSAALNTDSTLLDYAYSKNIALASPVSFWAAIKTVALSWQNEEINKNAKEIGELAKEFLKRVQTVASHGSKLSKAINDTVKHYNSFAKSLESSVLTSANKIAKKSEQIEIAPLEPLENETDDQWKKPELLDH